jgi:putative ABC transport system permease protein
MKFKKIIMVAVKSILKARMRSLLTALGIIIGVAAVVVMVAIGDGAQMQVQQQIAALGTNMLIVFPGSSAMGGINRGAGSINRFTMADVQKIQDDASLIQYVSPVVRTGAQVIGGAGNWSTQILGVATNYLKIRDWPLSAGSFFTDRDVLSRAKVAVLGQTVVNNLFPNEDPIGQEIRIRDVPFRVIGVLSPKGQSGMGTDNDDVIFAPSTTVLDNLVGGRYISYIQASAVSTDQIEQAQQQLTAIMRQAHHIRPGEDNDFTVRNQADITAAATATSSVLTVLLGSVAGVSLIVGGIGIMNIMLVSVTERTREIGIRLSVGARTSDILVQFLTEALVLSLSGGLIGIFSSFVITYIINTYTSQAAFIKPEIVLLAFSFAGIIGVFFGFYPARKAANLNPIDALRYE